MTCREFVDFLMAYLDGELGPERRADFEHHLVECPPCIDYLETYKTTVELTGGACRDPDGPVPEEVPDELVRAILAAVKDR